MGEDPIEGVLTLRPEAILLRWFNHHLERVSAIAVCFMLSPLSVAAAAAPSARRVIKWISWVFLFTTVIDAMVRLGLTLYMTDRSCGSSDTHDSLCLLGYLIKTRLVFRSPPLRSE